MIKFETGRCSHHEVDAHQRKDTCSQIINALSLINHVKGEQITDYIEFEVRAICQLKGELLFFTYDLLCLPLSTGLIFQFRKDSIV